MYQPRNEAVARMFRGAANARLSRTDKERILIRQDHRCFYCDVELGSFDSGLRFRGRKFVLDHFVPRSRGGAHGLHNRVAACTPCDGRKHSRMPTLEERVKLARQLTEYL